MFAVPAVAAALSISTFAAGVIVYGALAVASVGVNYVANKLLSKTPGSDQPSALGAEIDLRVGADVPQSLIVGRAVTAGSIAYAHTFASRGNNPAGNSDLLEIIAIADHPCDAMETVYIAGEEATLLAPGSNGQPVTRGYIVDDYANKVAIKFYDGTQVAADTLATTNLAAATDQPWTSACIGLRRAYLRPHLIYDQDKVPGRLDWKVVVRGAKLYDPRKDSTVGGSGAHRFTSVATHEWTENPAVIIYNILRGIYVLDGSGARQFFYGLDGTAADLLPLANWFAAMNECDVPIALAAGGTEPQFRAGGEIPLVTEPLEAIRELLKTCGGRLTENGGTYRMFVGAPGLPVASITDGDLRADRGDDFKPILGLDDRVNYVSGKYTSPSDGWIADAIALPVEDTDWQAEDGRRLDAELDAPMVQGATQMQRLQTNLLKRSRRQRKHVMPLPPAFFGVEPGDVIEWTSERNGYVGKLFEVDGVEYEANLCVTVSATEVDPTDYDWHSSNEFPPGDGTLPVARPAPKVVEGFDAEPLAWQGDGGTARPAIRLIWTDPQDGDASGVSYELRASASPADVTANSVSGVDVVPAEELVIVGGLQPATAYEIRARFLSANGYATTWSLWQPVTTPDTRDINELPEQWRRWIESGATEGFTELRGALARVNEAIGTLALQHPESIYRVRQEAVALEGRSQASVEEVKVTIATNEESLAAYKITLNSQFGDLQSQITNNYITLTNSDVTLAGQITTLTSTVNANTAAINTEATTRATETSALSAAQSTLSANVGSLSATVTTHSTAIATLNGQVASAYGVTLDVNGYATGFNLVNGGPGTSTFDVVSDHFRFAKPGVTGGAPVQVMDIGTVNGSAALTLRGTIIADNLIINRHIQNGEISASAFVNGGNSAAISIPSTDTSPGTGAFQGSQYVVLATAVVPKVRTNLIKVDIFAYANVSILNVSGGFFSLVLKQDGVVKRQWPFTFTVSGGNAIFTNIRQVWSEDITCDNATNSTFTLNAYVPATCVHLSSQTIAAGSIQGNLMRSYEISK